MPARPPRTARQAPIDPPDGEGDAPTTAERAEARERNHVVGAGWREKQEKTAKAEAIYARPQTVEAMLAYRADPQGPTLGEQWAQRFKQLDGKNGRPTVAEKVTVLWEASLSKRWGINGALVIAWFVSRLGEDANKFRVAWEKDGGTTTQGQHPLWATWRRLRDTPGEDPPPFDEWLIKREEAKPRTSGSPSPSASTPPKQSTPAPPSTSTPPEVSEEEAAAARARFLSLAKPVGAKPAPPPRRARLNPDATTLTTMLERELGDGADT